MENDKIGTFIEEKGDKYTTFTLQIKHTIPCTEEEKRIYGVDSKVDINNRGIYRALSLYFVNGEVFYMAQAYNQIAMHYPTDIYFQDLNDAKEYLIKKATEQKLLK